MDQNSLYLSNLDKKFKNHKKIKLGFIISECKRDTIIPQGTLVVMPFTSGEVRLKILEKDTPNKGFSVPLIINEEGVSNNITPSYLSWFLMQGFVKEFLLNFVTGSVFPRIPKDVLYSIKIPLPKKGLKADVTTEATLITLTNPFRELIKKYYHDYQINYKRGNYNTCVILAGAIVEALLFQLLLENEVEQKFLDEDRMLGLGRLIQYVQLLKLDKKYEIPLNHLMELQKNRNSAIHIGLAIKRDEDFSAEDLKCFDQIIKYFGI